jgi:hypothetical protein
MTKKHFALATSLMALVAISGPAFAGTAKANASSPDLQSARVFRASHAAMQTETAEPNTHIYHGGPKYND